MNGAPPIPSVTVMTFNCARCRAPGAAVMTFSYPDRLVWLDEIVEAVEPFGYSLCADHADRMIPPHGWTLADRRTVTRLFAPVQVA